MQNYDLVIIGLGVSGISLAKEASKNNINYCVLEKNKTFGGVWINAHVNSSLQTHKDYYGYEDIKISESYSNYPNKKELLSYLNTVLDKYKITDKTKFNYNVKNVHYDNNNKLWIINNEIYTKYLGICSGYLTVPNTELINSELRDFNGKIYHSKDFNKIKLEELRNKNLVIIGNGASACDVLKNLEKQKLNCNLTMIYRSDKYFIGKYIFNIPISKFLNKFLLKFGKYSPLWLYRFIIICINYFYFNNYLPIPKSKMNSKNLIASTIICDKLNDKSLVYINDKIKYSFKKNLILKNQIITNIDTVILATGYNETFKFLENQPTKEKYLQIFDKNFKNCAFIGFSPSYNWSKVSEKQSKIFIDYILGNFSFDSNSYEKYKLKHQNSQKFNDLEFHDLTYELFNY